MRFKPHFPCFSSKTDPCKLDICVSTEILSLIFLETDGDNPHASSKVGPLRSYLSSLRSRRMKNVGSARYARERETRGTFTIACLPPSLFFFRAMLIFHAPATQANTCHNQFPKINHIAYTAKSPIEEHIPSSYIDVEEPKILNLKLANVR